MGRPTTVRRDPYYLGPAIEVAVSELQKYEKKNEWVIEPKYDGMFASFSIQNPADGRSHVLNSRDARTPPITGTNAGDLLQLPLPMLPEGTVLAGELEASTQWATKIAAQRGYRQFHAFDMVQLGKQCMRNLPLYQRKELLALALARVNADAFAASRIRLVTHESNHFEDRYRAWIAQGFEGVVLKKKKSLYKTRALDGKTLEWVRCKKTYTWDYVLIDTERTAGEQITGVWGLLVNGKYQRAMRAFAPPELLVPANYGKLVAEFSGWALFKSGALRHAQFSRVRTDKMPDACVLPGFTEE